MIDRRAFLAALSPSVLIAGRSLGRGPLAAGLLVGACEPAPPDRSQDGPSSQPERSRASASSLALPAWFTANRVHIHTRLGENWIGRPQFLDAAFAVSARGGAALVRHVKSGARVEQVATQAGRDRMLAMLASAREAGVHLIAYYWHMSDDSAAGQHPDWVCRAPNGEVATSPRGPSLDLMSDYRELVLERLLELASAGFAGAYFDSSHFPVQGCFGSALEQAFREREGGTASEGGEATRAFLRFQARAIVEVFDYWRSRVNERYPEFVFVVSTGVLPGLANPRMSSELARVVHSPKSEFALALNPAANMRVFGRASRLEQPPRDVRMAFGYVLLRDAAEGRPPHIWIARIPRPADLLRATAAVLSHGCIANVDVPEVTLAREVTEDPAWAAAVRLGGSYSVIGGARPMRWAAVHFSEAARDRRGSDDTGAWRDVLWPAVGAFGALVEEGVPTRVVTDAMLRRGELEGVRVLIVASGSDLEEDFGAAIDAFRDEGGHVIVCDPGWDWATNGMGAAGPLRARLREIAAAFAPPVRVVAARGRPHVTAYSEGSKRFIAIAAPFADVGLDSEPEDQADSDGQAEIDVTLLLDDPCHSARDLTGSTTVQARTSRELVVRGPGPLALIELG